MQPSDLKRDCRGWFYRALAPDPASAVLEIGDAFAANWFDNVTRGDLSAVVTASHSPGFDMVLLHNTLGGCSTLQAAIRSGAGALRSGGLLIVAGQNRLRGGLRLGAMRTLTPRASGWGFRSSMARAGFENIVLYVVHPELDAPVHVIQVDRRSAGDFFRGVRASGSGAGWSLRRLAMSALITTNLMPYLQPNFIVVGRKC